MQSVNLGSNTSVQAWSHVLPEGKITVAVLDTGVFPHPDFADRLVGFKDFVNGRSEPYDDVGQGTHVAGIIAGSSFGARPEANLLGVKVGDDQGQVTCERVIQGIEWVMDNRGTLQADILSLPALENDAAVEESIRRAIEAGVIVVQACDPNEAAFLLQEAI